MREPYERLLLNGRLKVVESRNRVLGDFRGPELEVLLLFLQIMGLLFLKEGVCGG